MSDESKTTPPAANAAGCSVDPVVGRLAVLKRRVKYYEQMHKDARLAINIASKMSAEMKERRIEARRELEAAQESSNEKDQ